MVRYSFQDDYSHGAHPEILKAIVASNETVQAAYGGDEHTENACRLIRERMNDPDAAVHLIASGTLANIVVIGSCLRPYEAVIAASTGHAVVREAGAIEATGHKIITVPQAQGKLTAAGIKKAVNDNSQYPHMARPRLVYISNATEVGTIYTKLELTDIADTCKQHGLILFLDGARLGVALSSEKDDLTLEDIGRLTDVFWIGGTKNGTLLGEAIVITKDSLKLDFAFHLKQRGGLLSKGRILGAQFEALFSSSLFSELALNANSTAKALSVGIQRAGYTLAQDTDTNQIFAIFPDDLITMLREDCSFHVWERLEDGRSVVRLVTSWATGLKDVQGFLSLL